MVVARFGSHPIAAGAYEAIIDPQLLALGNFLQG